MASSLFLLGTLCSNAALAELSHDYGTNGYFRIGTGLSDNDAAQEVFKAPGASSKYRLGNENDTYIELGGYNTIRQNGEGAYLRTEIMGIFTGAQNEEITFDEVSQLYAEAGDFTTALGNPKLWIGKRYYDRYDIHINDYFYLNTLQGFTGGGIRDVDFGFGKLALAVGRQKADNDIYQTRFDARLSDIAIGDQSSVTLWGGYDSSGSKSAIKGLSGYSTGVMLKDEDLLGSINTFMVQYGKGLGRHAGTGGIDAAAGNVTNSADANNFEDAETFRIVNSNLIEPSDDWALMTALVYETKNSKSYDGTDQEWLSLGMRPMWFVNKNFRVPLEIGYDYVKDNTSDTDGSLFKTTLAAEFALERGFWERPVLRAFITHASWSNEFKGQVGGITYANDTSGWTAGIQAEMWW